MTLQSIADLQTLSREQLETTLLETKKELFKLRLKQATRQSIKPHFFKGYKRKIAQILTILAHRDTTI